MSKDKEEGMVESILIKESKYHRNCGGVVVWREGTRKDHFKRAGFCLDCDAFPILIEDIIFKVKMGKNKGKFERLNDDDTEWEMFDSYENLPERSKEGADN